MKNPFIIKDLIPILIWILIFFTIKWIVWISYSWLKSNEFGDAINPVINLVTVLFLFINWRLLREEINEEKRVNRKNEWANIWATKVELIKNRKNLLEQLWRWDTIDPTGWINIKLKNFWSFPATIEETKLYKIKIDWTEEAYNNIWNWTNNIVFPWNETDWILKIWAPNQPNMEFKWIKLRYELKFNSETDTKILNLYFNYIWFKTEDNELWYIPSAIPRQEIKLSEI